MNVKHTKKVDSFKISVKHMHAKLDKIIQACSEYRYFNITLRDVVFFNNELMNLYAFTLKKDIFFHK